MADLPDFREDILRRVGRMEQQLNLLRVFFVNTQRNQLAMERADYERTRQRRLAEVDLLQSQLADAEQGQRWGWAQEGFLSLFNDNPIWTRVQQRQPQDGTSNTREESTSRPVVFEEPTPHSSEAPNPTDVADDVEPLTTPAVLPAVQSTTIEQDLESIISTGTIVQNVSELEPIINHNQESDGHVDTVKAKTKSQDQASTTIKPAITTGTIVQNVSELEPESIAKPVQESDRQVDPVKAKRKTKSPDQASTTAGWIDTKKSLLKKQSSLNSRASGHPDSPWPIRGTRAKLGPNILKPLVIPTNEEPSQNSIAEKDVLDSASMPPPIPGQTPTTAVGIKRKLPKIPQGLIEQPPVKVRIETCPGVNCINGLMDNNDILLIDLVEEEDGSTNDYDFEKPTESQKPKASQQSGLSIRNNEDAVAKDEDEASVRRRSQEICREFDKLLNSCKPNFAVKEEQAERKLEQTGDSQPHVPSTEEFPLVDGVPSPPP